MQLVEFIALCRSLKKLSKENTKWAEVYKTWIQCVWLFVAAYILRLLTEAVVSLLILLMLMELIIRSPLGGVDILGDTYDGFDNQIDFEFMKGRYDNDQPLNAAEYSVSC